MKTPIELSRNIILDNILGDGLTSDDVSEFEDEMSRFTPDEKFSAMLYLIDSPKISLTTLSVLLISFRENLKYFSTKTRPSLIELFNLMKGVSRKRNLEILL